MKKKIFSLALCFMLLFNIKAFAAAAPEIEAVVNGTVDKGQTIQILINIKEIDSFFAGSMEFKYDKNILKVKSIELGDLISKPDVNKFDAMNKIDDTKGMAAYGFSCLGKINGFSGTGTFVKINAEVLKKDSFHIRSKAFLKEPNDDFNLKLQICDSNIKELEYNFKPYEFNLNGASGTTGSNAGTNNSTGASSSNNGGSTENTNKDNSSGTSNTNTSANTSSSQNSTSKNTSTEEKNDKTIIQKIISSVTSVFNGDKKNDSKKTDTQGKTEDTNKKTETQNNTGDSNKTTGDTNKKAEDENKDSSKINSAANKNVNSNSSKVALIIVLVLLIVIAAGGYLVYKKKNKK